VQAKLSDLNFQIVNRFGKDLVVQVKRLKKAYNQNIWKHRPNKEPNRRKKKAKEYTEYKQETQEEEQGVIITWHGIVTGLPQVDDQTPDPGRARQGSPRCMATPAEGPQRLETPDSARCDSSYVPPDTPRSRRELSTRRTEPPHTRLRARMQAVSEQREEEGVSDD
jgi:hypothetical protein